MVFDGTLLTLAIGWLDVTDADVWGAKILVLALEIFVVLSDGLEDTVLVVNKLVAMDAV